MCLLACLVFLLAGCRLLPATTPSVTLALLGDISLGRGLSQAHQDGDWQLALHPLQPVLKRASLALANLESPLTGQVLLDPGGGYNLCAPSKSVRALTAAGLDLLSLANNHQDDCLEGGLDQTRQILESSGLVGLSPELVPVIREVNGLKLAFLAFDDVGAELDITTAQDAIAAADTGMNIVVVSVHWGAEYQASPTPRQRKIAAAFSEAGADIIWGHHPHVLQRMEWYESTIDGHRGLVMYSLGNLLADQWMLPDAMRTALARIDFINHEIKRIQVLPLQLDAKTGTLQVVTQHELTSLISDRLGLDDLDENGVRIEVGGNK